LEAIKPFGSLLASFFFKYWSLLTEGQRREVLQLKRKGYMENELFPPHPLGRLPAVIYNTSPRGGQSTSLANLFHQKNEPPHLFCTWEEDEHPNKM
jgi:hypothetical protein